MKKSIAILFALLIALAASFAAHAQARSIKADIPFEFSAANRTLPAGEYVLERLDAESIKWNLRRTDNSESIVIVTISQLGLSEGRAKIGFRRYGENYFLTAFETLDNRITLAKSRTERDFLKRKSEEKIAKADIVVLKAK